MLLRRRTSRGLAIVLPMIAACSAFAVPAAAQFFEDRPWSYRPRHSFSSPFFGQRGVSGWRGPYVQQPPADSKAPPPRKPETPPTSEVLVIGDSLADWLAYGLEEVFADTPEIGIVRKIKPYSGLVRYEAHNDSLEWPQALKETLATEKPKVIIVMLGLNDRQPLRERIGQRPKNQQLQLGKMKRLRHHPLRNWASKARALRTLPPRLLQPLRPPQAMRHARPKPSATIFTPTTGPRPTASASTR